MRYQNRDLQQVLARTYVVGTLRGSARRRFERLMLELPELQQRVRVWQQWLQPLADAVPEAIPPDAVWRAIRSQVSPRVESRRTAAWLPAWFGQAMLAALTVAVIGLGWFALSRAPAPVDYVAVLAGIEGSPAAVATARLTVQQLEVSLLEDPQLSEESDLELWAVSRTDGETRSLGVLARTDRVELQLSSAQARLIRNAESLLITVESVGGSPIGEPSGEVFSTGLCVRVQGWQSVSPPTPRG